MITKFVRNWPAALAPIGAAIAAAGVDWLRSQAKEHAERVDELGAAIAAREAYLDGTGPRPEMLTAQQMLDAREVSATDRPSWRPLAALAGGALIVFGVAYALSTRVPGWLLDEPAAGEDLVDEHQAAAEPEPGGPPAGPVDSHDPDAGPSIPLCPWPQCPGFDPPADLPEAEQRLQATLHIQNCVYRPPNAAVRR